MTDKPAVTATDHAGVKVPPPLFYVAGLVLGAVLQRVLPLGVWPRQVGVALALPCLIFGLFLCGWAVRLFREFRTSLVPIVPSKALVVRGPYRFTRNPMYVGLASIYLGIGLWFRLSWGVLLLPVVLLCIYYLVIAREERYLARRFGEVYTSYRGEVRRWL